MMMIRTRLLWRGLLGRRCGSAQLCVIFFFFLAVLVSLKCPLRKRSIININATVTHIVHPPQPVKVFFSGFHLLVTLWGLGVNLYRPDNNLTPPSRKPSISNSFVPVTGCQNCTLGRSISINKPVTNDYFIDL